MSGCVTSEASAMKLSTAAQVVHHSLDFVLHRGLCSWDRETSDETTQVSPTEVSVPEMVTISSQTENILGLGLLLHNSDENKCRICGMKRGSKVWIRCSVSNFYNLWAYLKCWNISATKKRTRTLGLKG